MTRVITRLEEISGEYDVLFCDLWGCLHDGRRAYPQAVAALTRFRAGGGRVVLLTNAPRHAASVARQLDRLEVPPDCRDEIVTSGDAARRALFAGAVGEQVFFIGEPHDLSFFDLPDGARPITRVPLEQAQGIVCTGPFDPHARPEALRPQLLYAKQKGLPMLCANPDLFVDRGGVREYCAGAIARLYEEMGGRVLYFGKPHPPIYDLARQRLAASGQPVPDRRILAIGDGIDTDIRGAMGEDLDALFITGGLAARETATPPGGQPDPDRLAAFLAEHRFDPLFTMGFLR